VKRHILGLPDGPLLAQQAFEETRALAAGTGAEFVLVCAGYEFP
jgi:hypothetical protein